MVVYDDSTVADALRLENVYTYADITLSENDEAELPTDLPKLLPENSGYQLEWRIVEVGTYGASYKTSDDNITLENDKIEPIKAHDESASTRLELVAVKEGETNVRSFSQTSRFNVTVTAAPVIELTGLTVAPAKVNLANVGDTYQLSAVKEPVNATGNLSWESSNTGVATVDSTTGMVTAVAKGEATITVTCGSESDTCTVLVAHTHDYTGQTWQPMGPGLHSMECVAHDYFKTEPHNFSEWTDKGDGTHSRTCSKCNKPGETANYTETAEHTWVWVVDQEAALNQPGKQHEECTGCPARRSEDTVIPALQDYAVAVTCGTATVAAGTITRAMEGVEVTVTAQAPAGKHFVKWVVKAGGVTLANETSATTTFIMPAEDVAIEANFEKNASTGTGTGATTYPITVKSAKNGDVTVSPRNASKGTTVTLTVEPDKGYTLETITVTDKNGDEIALTNKGDGKYTFKMPAGKVYVEATFMEDNSMLNFFVDVPADAYYYDAVLWAAKNGITGGVDDTHFAPNATCTRAQVVTFLWRAAGSPAPKSSMIPFTDVPAGSYYEQAVLWAVENGITDGTSATTFSPDAVCSRGQIVTFLWRSQKSPASDSVNPFADVAADAYYNSAVLWAAENGITGGTSATTFSPNNDCTRAQIVTFLFRCLG